ncbi:Transcription initiation factor TFIID subunit 12 [Elasticomyces elasticus]|nr:Transcription initiation factor TFIID subunit 12 [Elasticomyces elasticus]
MNTNRPSNSNPQGSDRMPMIRPHDLDKIPTLSAATKAHYKEGLDKLWRTIDMCQPGGPKPDEKLYQAAVAKMREASGAIMKEMNQYKSGGSSGGVQQGAQGGAARPQSQGQQGQTSQAPSQTQPAPPQQHGPLTAQQHREIVKKSKAMAASVTVYPPPNMGVNTEEFNKYKNDMHTHLTTALISLEMGRVSRASLMTNMQGILNRGDVIPQTILENKARYDTEINKLDMQLKEILSRNTEHRTMFTQQNPKDGSAQPATDGSRSTGASQQTPSQPPDTEDQRPSSQMQNFGHSGPDNQSSNIATADRSPNSPSSVTQPFHETQQTPQQNNQLPVTSAKQQTQQSHQGPQLQQPLNYQPNHRPLPNTQQHSNLPQSTQSPSHHAQNQSAGQTQSLSYAAAMSAAARNYCDQEGRSGQSSTPTSSLHQPSFSSGQQNPQSKMPIPKQLNLAPPQPVAMPPGRPTLGGGMGGGAPGMMGQPAIARNPVFVLEGEGDRVLHKKKLDELVKEVTGGGEGEGLAPDVEESVLNLADDFIDNVITLACQLAKLRPNQTLDIRDIQLVLERNYNIRIPGYSLDEVRTVRKFQPAPGWTQKMNAVQAAKVMGKKSE